MALQAYALGLWPLAIVRVVVPAFYALRDVRTPVLAALAALAANALASLALIGTVPADQSSWLAAMIARAAASSAYRRISAMPVLHSPPRSPPP